MKNVYRLLIATTAFILVASCTPEVEDAFNKPSAVRIAESIKNTKDILTAAPNGWRMAYQGSGGFGGYNILCKFGTDNNVFCEEETENVKATSHYKIQQGQGVLLSFDSFNSALHKYSDPVGVLNGKAIGQNGKGFEGDFEFRVMSCSKDSVVLEGRKHGDRVVLTPMPENLTWANFFADVKNTTSAMYSERYNLIIDNETYPVEMKYHTLTFVGKEGKTIEIPFIYTKEGMEILRESPLYGKKMTRFTYSADDKWLDVNDKTIQLCPRAATPLEALFLDDWSFNTVHSSTTEVNIWRDVATYATSQNNAIVTLFFSNKPGYLSFSSYVGNGWGDIKVNYSVSGNDQLTISGFITRTKTADEKNGTNFYNNFRLKDIANTFLTNGNPTTYTLTINDSKHPTSLRMTSNDDSNKSFVFDRGVWRVDF